MSLLVLCGVDEAGRGPLAGPVCAAAVVLDHHRPVPGLRDSKKLTAAARDRLAVAIRTNASAWALGWASVGEIDRLNILQATMAAMRRAVEALDCRPSLILVDGNRLPDHLGAPARAIIGGDSTEAAISAASILAKTARDAQMLELAQQWPGYGFERHKGYDTPAHREALFRMGPCPEHRHSFAPVARAAALRAEAA